MKLKKLKEQFYNKFTAVRQKAAFLFVWSVTAIQIMAAEAFATSGGGTGSGDFSSSTIAVGTQNLFNDILNWAYIIVPIVGTLFIVYYAIRRSGADEQEKKRWTDRIITALISTVLGVIAGAVLQLALSYYQ